MDEPYGFYNIDPRLNEGWYDPTRKGIGNARKVDAKSVGALLDDLLVMKEKAMRSVLGRDLTPKEKISLSEVPLTESQKLNVALEYLNRVDFYA